MVDIQFVNRDKMRALRARKGWSQSELGRRSNLHNTSINLIENGKMAPYPGQLDKICKALGCKKGDLL